MPVRHARPSMRPRRAALIGAIGALAILGGITGANAALQGDDSAPVVVGTADPTGDADVLGSEPVDLDSTILVADNQATGFSGTWGTSQAGSIVRTAPPATSEAPSSGTGWTLSAIRKYRATGYTIKFTDQRAVDWLAQYMRPLAAHLTEITGLRFAVDTAPVGAAYQQQAGELMVNLYERPCKLQSEPGANAHYVPVRDGSGVAGVSCGYSWMYSDLVLRTGEIWINADNFDAAGKPKQTPAGVKNLMAHEMGHAMGLKHANTTSAANDCVKGADAGEQPVMCAPSARGYQDGAAGRFVQQFDVQGIRTLAANGGAHVPPQGSVIGIGGRCLDARGGKSADGTQIQIWSCNGADAQRWIVNADGTITAFGKCLDNYAAKAVNGNKIQLHTCNFSPAQKWRVDAQGRIVNVGTGMALDVRGSSTENGTIVHLWTPHTGANQKWMLPRTVYAAN